MKNLEITKLQKIAKEIRITVLKMLFKAGSGHLGSSFSVIEVLVALYFGGLLKYDPQKPSWDARDYFLLSNGHACPTLYAILAKAGYFPETKLNYLRELNSGLEGHPRKGFLPGIEISSGSLGMGLSQGIGLALGLRLNKANNKVVVMMSDGEHDEGSVWEAIMSASQFKLNNLIAIVDRNGTQIGGFTEEQMALEPLVKKYLSFNWHILEVNGHDFGQIMTAFSKAYQMSRPTVIISHTKGCKGLSFMEGKPNVHNPKITQEFFEKALIGLTHG